MSILACATMLACSTRSTPLPEPGRPALSAPPWAGTALNASELPQPYLTEWSRAENRQTCALLAFRDLGDDGRGATPRAAQFGGGWGVAYDLGSTRSAFGVAGTGVEPNESTYDEWPRRIVWADGSRVGYGPEGGGAGPNQLAYLRVAGQRCLYNVWSRISIEHLEHLLQQLRFARR